MTTTEPTTATSTSPRRPRARRMGTFAVAAVVTLALLAAGSFAWLSATSIVREVGQPDCTAVELTLPQGATPQAAADDHEAICAALSSLGTAWAQADASAYAELFTDNATYTTWVGTHYAGRDDIEVGHRALFDGVLAGTRLADAYLAVELIHPDVAVVTTRGDTYEGEEGDDPGDLAKVQTYTLVREDDGWRVAAFHNTQRRPVMERVQFLVDPASRPAAER